MNNYNKSQNKLLLILTIKFNKYKNQYLFKWETNYYVYFILKEFMLSKFEVYKSIFTCERIYIACYVNHTISMYKIK